MADELLQKFVKTYAPGAVICKEGDEGNEMYIIQKGKVRVSKRIAGKTDVISVLEKGEFFGEMALVNRIQRTATVTAIDAVELLVFDHDGLRNMVARNPKIALTIIDKLCRRLQSAHLKIQHLVKRDAAGLIAIHLRYMFQEMPNGQASSSLQKTVEEISLSLELPMEDVRKALERLQAASVLSIMGDSLVLRDSALLDRLTETVGGDL